MIRQSPRVRKSVVKLLSVISFAFALGLLALAVMWSRFVLAEVWTSDSRPFDFRLAGGAHIKAPTSLPSDGATKSVAVRDHDNGQENSYVTLTFTAFKLLSSESKLLTDLELEVPASIKERIEPRLSDIVSCEEDNLGRRPHLGLEEPHQDKNLLVHVQNEIGTENVKTRIPLETLLASSVDPDADTCEEASGAITDRPTTVRVPVELPVVSGPVQSYPSNWHQMSVNVRVKLPQGFTLAEDSPRGASDSASVQGTSCLNS